MEDTATQAYKEKAMLFEEHIEAETTVMSNPNMHISDGCLLID